MTKIRISREPSKGLVRLSRAMARKRPADGVEDPLLGVGDVLHILYLLRLKRANLSSDRSDCASPDADSGFQRKIWKIQLFFYFMYNIK